MSEQPNIKDRESWKRIGNAAMFMAGSICFLFWLFNGPMRPDPNRVLHGRTWEIIQSGIHPDQITGFAGFMLHTGLLWLAVPLLFLSIRNQIRWKKQRDLVESKERSDRTERNQAALSPISQLSSRRANKKKQEEIEIEVKGEKVKLRPMSCDVGNLILPGDHRFKGLTFDKVIGQQEAKFELQEFLDFLQNPDAYAAMEAKVPRGVLMHGTHGVGKTMLARTLASLCGLPVIEVAGSEFVEMFVGVGASRMRQLFDDLDYLVTIFGGAILFIDEFDAVARARGSSNGGAQETESTLNQLLKEMDGITPRPRVFTFAATNRKDILDPAAIRPGRFDRHIEFFNPTRPDREKLLAVYLPERLRAPGLNLSVAAKACPGASGAHVANIANEAKILAVRAKLTQVTQDILDEAVLKTMWGARRDGQRQVLTAAEVDTVKKHESGHALVYMKLSGRAPLRFTIIPRGQSGGHVAFPDNFETLVTKEHLVMRLAVLMGGWAATLRLRDGQEDSGISMDVKMATESAVQMVTQYGMSPLGTFHLPTLQQAGLVSEDFKVRIMQEVTKLVEQGKTTALQVVDDNRAELDKLVACIGEYETMLEPDFKREFSLTYANDEPKAPVAAGKPEGGSHE